MPIYDFFTNYGLDSLPILSQYAIRGEMPRGGEKRSAQTARNALDLIHVLCMIGNTMKKLAPPLEYRLTKDLSGLFLYWQHRQEEGEDVYKRTFTNPLQVENFIADRYGLRFARKIRIQADSVFAQICA